MKNIEISSLSGFVCIQNMLFVTLAFTFDICFDTQLVNKIEWYDKKFTKLAKNRDLLKIEIPRLLS